MVGLRAEFLQHLRECLERTDVLAKADLIFVLAGHPNRKVFGAKLFREQWATRVLMSTGDPPYIAGLLEMQLPPLARDSQVSRELHDTAARSSFPQGHYFAFLDHAEWSITPIRVRLFGTLSEIRALADWLQKRRFCHSILVVSAGIHLRRVQMCCYRLLPRQCVVRMIAVTLDRSDLASGRMRPERESLYRIVAEWGKILLYSVLLAFHRRPRVEDSTSY